MTERHNSILLLGESGVGKTHYGAQLLNRLMNVEGVLRMEGQSTNLLPFQSAMNSLQEGRAADHTATSTYSESVWPIKDGTGRRADLVWPDYGGEQIKRMIETRRIPNAWRERITTSPAWLMLVRLQALRIGDDIFSKPLAALRSSSAVAADGQVSDQARMIELLQMLLFVGSMGDRPLERPRLAVLLTCWDELGFEGAPEAVLKERLPLFWTFIRSSWRAPTVLGVSALERPLSPNERDLDYVAKGPENFGYVVRADGSRSPDLTLPIQLLLDDGK
ncbi:hypothetical protein P0R31_00735 [Bradyrhizobium yuanmingense]|uniref:TRAFAC clade GTPase domain-containing protein n=1 Tax=Bradyrhizobium yuanmingense TaxID=108015 RepID=UPI0023B8D668|nr:hypothetical protein [Bradyrhizobium yuanmingense]MDF0515767.1 hypothetical protein [Bradyrhizobium yuanmingense]